MIKQPWVDGLMKVSLDESMAHILVTSGKKNRFIFGTNLKCVMGGRISELDFFTRTLCFNIKFWIYVFKANGLFLVKPPQY